MRIQIAKDQTTGFPCIRLENNGYEDHFISVFPVTKIQVEEWIWKEAPHFFNEHIHTTAMINNMSLNNNKGAYPKKICLLKRSPVSQIEQNNILSIIATNLSLWEPDNENEEHDEADDIHFPTDSSEWGNVIKWLNGYPPDSEQWRKAQISYNQFKTRDLIKEILKANLNWSDSVKNLVLKYLELISDEERGLPFINKGLYELISDTKEFHRLKTNTKFSRPFIANNNDLWPILGDQSNSPWRVVLIEKVPVVTIRLWFNENNIIEQVDNENIQEAHINPSETIEEIKPPLNTPKNIKNNKRNQYIVPHIQTMDHLCPYCYKPIPEIIFEKNPIWCCLKKVEKRSKDGINDESGINTSTYEVREHLNKKPSDTEHELIIKSTAIHKEYLEIARKDPTRIKSITLGGVPKVGKTTWIQSLMGILFYPYDKSYLKRAFPAEKKLLIRPCTMVSLENNNELNDSEGMWIDGILPLRTKEFDELLRSPVLLETGRQSFLSSKNEKLVLIFNDIPGEIIGDPDRIIDYQHVHATTDVIFVQPADNIATVRPYFNNFFNGLGLTRDIQSLKGTKSLNLIFAISKIDIIKYSSDDSKKSLFEILTRKPFILPENEEDKSFSQYINNMIQVHHNLEDWMKINNPQFYEHAMSEFGSVRFCGFSSFGFEPMKVMGKNAESILPFEPQPIRAADPLLWILINDGRLI